MKKFTPSDILEITEQEKELKQLLNQTKVLEKCLPKRDTLDNILNYSKALSIRKSNYLDFIELNLN